MISICLARVTSSLPGQQRDLAHLRQVHAHRIVRPRLVLFDPFQQAVDVDIQIEIVQARPPAPARRGSDLVGIVEIEHRIFGQFLDRLLRARSRSRRPVRPAMRRTKQSSSNQSKSNKRQSKRRAVKPAPRAIWPNRLTSSPQARALRDTDSLQSIIMPPTGTKSHEILPLIFRPAWGCPPFGKRFGLRQRCQCIAIHQVFQTTGVARGCSKARNSAAEAGDARPDALAPG